MHRHIKGRVSTLLKENGRTYQRLIRLHNGITTGVWLVLFGAAYLLLNLTPDGGLSNLDNQALIFTFQAVVILLGLFLTPFWEAGASYVALDFIRDRRNLSSDLLEGFQYLKPMSLSMLFRGIQYALVYFISGSLARVVLQLAPFSSVFYADLTVLLTEPTTPLKGKMVIVAVVYGFVLVNVMGFLASQLFYRYRMTHYIILDNEETGGVKAALDSKGLMKKKKLAMFRLDLSFWWFYLPQILGLLLPIGALLISGFHAAPSARAEMICWVVAGCSLVLRLIIGVIGKPQVAAAYALFYEELSSPGPEVTVEDGPVPPFAR